MDEGFSMLLSIGTSVLFVGVAWGHTQAQIRSMKERIEEMRNEKASMERFEGFEDRIHDKLETLEERFNELRQEVIGLKKNS